MKKLATATTATALASASVTYTRAGYVPDLSGFNSSTVELSKSGKPEDSGERCEKRRGYTRSQFAGIAGSKPWPQLHELKQYQDNRCR
jgi:hypothetical protein